MKRSEAFPPRFLNQLDVPRPIVVTIHDLFKERVQDNNYIVLKTVMTFTNPDVKPLMLNGINWSVCETAFGEDSVHWRGKQVEIYIDPTVMYGTERTGGLRLRIPTPRPAMRPTGLTLEQQHQRGLLAMEQAEDLDTLEAWLQWRERFPTNPLQERETEDQYLASKERILTAPPATTEGRAP